MTPVRIGRMSSAGDLVSFVSRYAGALCGRSHARLALGRCRSWTHGARPSGPIADTGAAARWDKFPSAPVRWNPCFSDGFRPETLGLVTSWRHEHIADTAHGADGIGMSRIRLDLAAKASYPQVNRAIECLHLAMRGHLQKPIALQRPVWILGKHFQEVELACRQYLLAAIHRIDQHAFFEIEHAATHANPRSRGDGRPGRAPQDTLDTG